MSCSLTLLIPNLAQSLRHIPDPAEQHAALVDGLDDHLCYKGAQAFPPPDQDGTQLGGSLVEEYALPDLGSMLRE